MAASQVVTEVLALKAAVALEVRDSCLCSSWPRGFVSNAIWSSRNLPRHFENAPRTSERERKSVVKGAVLSIGSPQVVVRLLEEIDPMVSSVHLPSGYLSCLSLISFFRIRISLPPLNLN